MTMMVMRETPDTLRLTDDTGRRPASRLASHLVNRLANTPASLPTSPINHPASEIHIDVLRRNIQRRLLSTTTNHPIMDPKGRAQFLSAVAYLG